jgi:phosphosulfolactate phosphohydrolase-like enzyme
LLEGPRTDAAQIAEAVAAAYPTPLAALDASRGAIGLRREGLESDIAFCARESIVDVVPRLTRTVDGVAILEVATEGARPGAASLAGDDRNS